MPIMRSIYLADFNKERVELLPVLGLEQVDEVQIGLPVMGEHGERVGKQILVFDHVNI